MPKKTGIWLDFRRAHFLELDELFEKWFTIDSNIDEVHPKGGYGASIPYAGQDAVSEKRYLEKRKHQLQAYYNSILDHLKDTDFIVVFGPGEAKKGLKTYMSKWPNIFKNLHEIGALDSLTENQIRAHLKQALS